MYCTEGNTYNSIVYSATNQRFVLLFVVERSWGFVKEYDELVIKDFEFAVNKYQGVEEAPKQLVMYLYGAFSLKFPGSKMIITVIDEQQGTSFSCPIKDMSNKALLMAFNQIMFICRYDFLGEETLEC